MPEYEVKDKVYSTMLESCMVLDNNKRIHEDVNFEMNTTYKSKLDRLLKE